MIQEGELKSATSISWENIISLGGRGSRNIAKSKAKDQ